MEEKIDKRTKEYRDSVPVVLNDSPELAARSVSGSSTGLVLSGPIVNPDENVDPVPERVKPIPDFNHCPGCGAELLEDERSSKCVAHCKKCIWRNL